MLLRASKRLLQSPHVFGYDNEMRSPLEKMSRRYSAPKIPLSAIRRYAQRVARRFHPQQIILFGSFAYGTPHKDSDVDLLVVMPARNQIDQAIKIKLNIEANFPLDLIVRTPHNLRWRLREGDWFLREIVERGKVLYEKTDGRMGTQSRRRLRNGAKARARRKAAP